MTYKLTCPSCGRYTSELFRAYENGDNCPYCNGSLQAASAQYYRQLPDDHQGVDVATFGEDKPVQTYADTFNRGALGPAWQPVPYRTAGDDRLHRPFKRGAAKTPQAARAAFDHLRREATGWDKPDDAQEAALDAIRLMAERRHAAELFDEEMRIRAELIVDLAPKIAEEYGRQDGERTAMQRDTDPLGTIDWAKLAEVAVDSFAEYYRDHQEGKRR